MGKGRNRSNETNRRFRRLEKTVESLSHGLILALTQLKSGDMHADAEPHPRGSTSGPYHHPVSGVAANDEIEPTFRDHSLGDDDDDDGDLSTVFTRLRLMEKCTDIFMLFTLDADRVYMRSARRDQYGGTINAPA